MITGDLNSCFSETWKDLDLQPLSRGLLNTHNKKHQNRSNSKHVINEQNQGVKLSAYWYG